jgi:hypothetical protein
LHCNVNIIHHYEMAEMAFTQVLRGILDTLLVSHGDGWQWRTCNLHAHIALVALPQHVTASVPWMLQGREQHGLKLTVADWEDHC